ncbi:MAG: SDR family NAD(P)-dependent oxidoreductase [Chitinophagales bacterium]
MKGKTIVITGATSGIGYETALALAKKGARVIIISRDKNKIDSVIEKIQTLTSNKSIYGYTVDLSSQKQIREGCKNILQDFPHIDVLINNAGCWFSKLMYTEDMSEMQFAINHLATFLLTHLLLPALRKSDDPRVVNVNSDSHFNGKMHFNDVNLTKNYHGLRAYAQSKLANVLFTYEFDRRKHAGDPVMNALQPGLVKTDIGLKHTFPFHAFVWKLRRLAGISVAEGAATSIYLASSEECKGLSSTYWDEGRMKKSSAASYSIQDAQAVWALSEQLCTITNYFDPVL